MKNIALNSQNPAMTTCLTSAFFLGTSAAQAIAADDMVKQCASVVPESVCQPAPDTTQQQPYNIEKGGITSGRGKGKMSGSRMIQNPILSLYEYNIQAYNSVFFFSQLYEIKYVTFSYYISLLKL